MTEGDLPPRVANLTGGVPTSGLVESAPSFVVGERPEDGLAVACATQVIEGGIHEPAPHPATPGGGRDGDGVELSEVRVSRIATRSRTHKADDGLATFDQPPTHELGV